MQNEMVAILHGSELGMSDSSGPDCCSVMLAKGTK